MSSMRQPAGTGFAIRDALPWPDLSAIVRAAEAAGFTALFLPEISGRDAMVTLGALAGETRDLILGTGVLPMRSRTPLLAGMASATVHERSGGRLVLGVGTGPPRPNALEELRAYVLTLRSLLRGGSIGRPGREVRLALAPGSDVPIWISAMGPRAFRLAGEVADGALLNWCPPEWVAVARRAIEEGADAVGRDPTGISLAVYVRSWVGEDLDGAMPALRAAVTEYASYPAYRRQYERVGLGAEAAAAASAFESGRPEESPEALVHAVTAVGDLAHARLSAYREAGADLVVVYPVVVGDPAPSIEATLLALAPA